MTPSSTSEPELGNQPANAEPPENLPSPSPDAPPQGIPEKEKAKESTAVVEHGAEESDAQSATTMKAPVAMTATAATAATEPESTETVSTTEVSPTPPASHHPATAEVLDTGVHADDESDEDPLPLRSSDRYPTVIPMIGALVGLTALAALLVVAFALPAVKSVTPHKIPIGVSGAAEVTPQLEQIFASAGSDKDTFAITTFTDDGKLRTAIRDRELYGGLSVTDSAVTMLVSTGASPATAELLSSIANSISSRVGTQIPITDVVKMPTEDSRGTGLTGANLALAIGAILPALVLIPLYRRRPAAQLGVTVGASVLVGITVTAILSYVIDATKGSSFLAVAAGLTIGVLASSLLVLGLFAVFGRIGAGIGVAVLLLFAAPLSGLAAGPQWLPSPWGAIGQFLPPGANASLLRSVAYFDGRDSTTSLLILSAWALGGLLLMGVGGLITTDRRHRETPTDQENRELVFS